MTDWKEYEVQELFNVVYGVNLELVNCIETDKDDPEAVAFVSRTELNNGVSAYVKPVPGVEPQPKNTITVAGGGSVLATFLQTQPFYSGRDLYLLYPKCCISNKAKLFLVTIIKANKYRYNYGRQANVTLSSLKLKLPATADGTPDWQWMESYIDSLHSKALTSANAVGNGFRLNTEDWREFLLADYFDIVPGKYHYPDEYEEGNTPYYSATNENNGIAQNISLKPDFSGNCIVTGKIGCTAFYVPDDFCATSDVNIFKPKFCMTPYIGLFVASVINLSENYKWAYGRQCRVGNSKKIRIKLPATPDGKPDWQWMESYIKSLPYGDRL